MTYDNIIHELFPHRQANGGPSYRPSQFEVIRDTLDAFDDDSVTDVVVEAPTGAGKTSIAVTVARVMTRGFDELLPRARAMAAGNDIVGAMESLAPRQAHLITSMKLLQDAYLGDDPGIRLVKGKGNYSCGKHDRTGNVAAMAAAMRGVEHDFSCDDAEAAFGRLCNRCPYKDAREDARFAPIALHNFDSFLNQATLGGAFTPRRLLTIDETHNAEEKIRGFMTLELTPAQFRALDLSWESPTSDDIEVITDWVVKLSKMVSARCKAVSDRLGTLRNGKQGPRQIEEMAKLVKVSRAVEGMNTRLGRFVSSRRPPTSIKPALWVATLGQRDSVVLEPVDAGRFVPSALMRFGDKRLHLSATVNNAAGSYTRSVNLRTETARFISVPSTFPVVNRRINVRSAGKLGARDWDKNFPDAVDRVRAIIAENPGVRGVVHCTSYHMTEQFASALSDVPRIRVYDRMNRNSVVGSFMSGESGDDAVLLAVGLTEGYDFKDDLCRFQVLVRVPYPVPGKCMRARMDKDPKFYGWRTSLTLVQTYGRGVRSASDFCKTYVLDERFTSYVNRERQQLPDWFLEAIE